MKGFALFAILLALILWPFVPQAQSPELMEAFGRYLALYQQGRYAEAIPNFKRSSGRLLMANSGGSVRCQRTTAFQQ